MPPDLLPAGATGTDAALARLRAAADSLVRAFRWRPVAGGRHTEHHPGGARVIFLRHYPVTGVRAVRVDAALEFGDDTVIDPGRYVLHPTRGVLECTDGTFVPTLPGWDIGPDYFPRAVRVTYDEAGDVLCAAYQAWTECVGPQAGKS